MQQLYQEKIPIRTLKTTSTIVHDILNTRETWGQEVSTVLEDGESVHGLDVLVRVGGWYGRIEDEGAVSSCVAVVRHQFAHVRVIGQVLQKTEHNRA